jgi:Ethanolamine ammonia-lyase, small subunit
MTGYAERDPWERLRLYTAARIAIGRAGTALPTAEVLAQRLALAAARDAVTREVELGALRDSLSAIASPACAALIELESAASSKEEYLRRPDLGRRLSEASRELLEKKLCETESSHTEPQHDGRSFDLVLVLGDGLSSLALERQARPFLAAFLPLVADLRVAQPCFVRHARVAVGDDVAAALGAGAALVLIGERPGLSSPDSMGLYLTIDPVPGTTDERRNCISNVRPAGFDPKRAAFKAEWLLRAALSRRVTGVALKDEEPAGYLPLLARP